MKFKARRERWEVIEVPTSLWPALEPTLFGHGAYILDTNLSAFLVLKALALVGVNIKREPGILEQRAGRDGHMDPQSPNNIFSLRTKSKE